MPPIVINLQQADDPRDAVHRAVQALAEGKLVAFPTETTYVMAASALCADAVERMMAARGPGVEQPLTLAIRSADDALDYIPSLSPLARRLARRCWPGPVTLMLRDDHADSLVKQLPVKVQGRVQEDGWLSLRVPAHPVVLGALRLFAGPLVITSAAVGGDGESVTAKEVVGSLGESVHMVLDDGPSKFGQPASVVKVDGRRLEIVRVGVLAAPTLRRLADLMILVICTGNTCRSPMAEALLKRLIAERMGCKIDELESRGVIVMSAGIAAMAGGRAAAEAIAAMNERGLDLSKHESQPLTERLVRYADLVLSMTRGHREAVLAQWPDAAGRIELVSREQTDIADPIGGPAELYRRCAVQIEGQLQKWVQELDLESIALADDRA